ncbi:kelch domain-containing protein 1-like isoform X2 [Bacillus rossius redtenbacheri]|uniref:kelch domain-containing protein 1-like isoform X2 n=1 Tax=Bacillus rossius redtenbacheri TaxID=93214 RepID=UPI002FDE722B
MSVSVVNDDAALNNIHDRIHRRSGHTMVYYNDFLILWGGYMEYYVGDEVVPHCVYHMPDEVYVYNCFTEMWDRVQTYGDIPPKSSGSCAVVHGDDMYVFGGYQNDDEDETLDGNSDDLYRLHIPTMMWTLLHPEGLSPSPCDKLVGWVYGDKLYFFGGFGPTPTVAYVSLFDFIMDPPSLTTGWPRGWNNQLVAYDITSNRWEWPQSKGPTPRPRAAHAADISGSCVYVFGGRLGMIRVNDLYCLHLDTLTWSSNLTDPSEATPPGRSWHSFNFTCPEKAVIYGGLNSHNTVLSDCWCLNLATRHWTQVQLAHKKPRLWHKAQYVQSCQLLMVGGHKHNILNPMMKKMTAG